MQERFAGYEHLYSGVYFELRSAAPRPATILERLAFWLGSSLMWVAAPATFPLASYYTRLIRKKGMLRIPPTRPRVETR